MTELSVQMEQTIAELRQLEEQQEQENRQRMAEYEQQLEQKYLDTLMMQKATIAELERTITNLTNTILKQKATISELERKSQNQSFSELETELRKLASSYKILEGQYETLYRILQRYGVRLTPTENLIEEEIENLRDIPF